MYRSSWSPLLGSWTNIWQLLILNSFRHWVLRNPRGTIKRIKLRGKNLLFVLISFQYAVPVVCILRHIFKTKKFSRTYFLDCTLIFVSFNFPVFSGFLESYFKHSVDYYPGCQRLFFLFFSLLCASFEKKKKPLVPRVVDYRLEETWYII